MGTSGRIDQGLEPISLSVVIMAFNEEANLPHLLPLVIEYLSGHRRISDWEILVVDDGSTDGTAREVAEAAQREPRIRLLRHPENRGMGAAIRTGYEAACCDFVTQLPADLQVLPTVFDRFLPYVPAHDLVLSVYEDRNERPIRRVLSRGYRIVGRLLMGQRADYTGTMLFRRSLLEGVEITSDSFVANLEFPLKALNRGASHALVTFVPEPRFSGASKVANSRRIWFVFKELLGLRRRGL
jgi:glycosyltransferase involved in cell wall biosynthesis